LIIDYASPAFTHHPLHPRRRALLGWGLGLALSAVVIHLLWMVLENYVLDSTILPSTSYDPHVIVTVSIIAKALCVVIAWPGYWLLTAPPTPLRRPFWHGLLRWYVRLCIPLTITCNLLFMYTVFVYLSSSASTPIGELLAHVIFFVAKILFFIEPLTCCALLWFLSDLTRTIPALRPPAHLWRLRYLTAGCIILAPLLLWLPTLAEICWTPMTRPAWTTMSIENYRTLRACSLALDYLGTLGLCFLLALLLHRLRTTPNLEQTTQPNPPPP
jgi:hypothetical protein